jgi:hypothetical protein
MKQDRVANYYSRWPEVAWRKKVGFWFPNESAILPVEALSCECTTSRSLVDDELCACAMRSNDHGPARQ